MGYINKLHDVLNSGFHETTLNFCLEVVLLFKFIIYSINLFFKR